jgi:hypothetical protein
MMFILIQLCWCTKLEKSLIWNSYVRLIQVNLINANLFNPYIRLFSFLANAVDNITVEWNTDPQLSLSGLVRLAYENVSYSNDFNQLTVLLPSSILMQGNKIVSLNL